MKGWKLKMAKVIHKGIKEDGTLDTEVVQTPILITQLIGKLPNMCEAEIQKELEEIRKSAEQDERIRKGYVAILKKHNLADGMNKAIKETKSQLAKKMVEQSKRGGETNMSASKEKVLIYNGIEAIKRCVKNHDLTTAFTICKLCKAIAGDRFSVEIEP